MTVPVLTLVLILLAIAAAAGMALIALGHQSEEGRRDS